MKSNFLAVNLLEAALGLYDRQRLQSLPEGRYPVSTISDRESDIAALGERFAGRTEARAALAWLSFLGDEHDVRTQARDTLERASGSFGQTLDYAGTFVKDDILREEFVEAIANHNRLAAAERLAEMARHDPDPGVRSCALGRLTDIDFSEGWNSALALLETTDLPAEISGLANRILNHTPVGTHKDGKGRLLSQTEKETALAVAALLDPSVIDRRETLYAVLLKHSGEDFALTCAAFEFYAMERPSAMADQMLAKYPDFTAALKKLKEV